MFKFIQETESNDYFGFIIEKDYYCINVSQLQEILYIPPISKIPNVPSYIEGAINLRGKIVRIVNMHKWLKLPWRNFTEKSRIVVIADKEGLFGILVDDVAEVFHIEKSMQHELPGIFQQDSGITYINSIIFRENFIYIEINPKEIKTE